MDIIEEIIKMYIEPAILEVREEFAQNFDLSIHVKYKGLNDKMLDVLQNKLEKALGVCASHYSFEILRGEQTHSPRIPSHQWGIRHEWLVVYVAGVGVYLDPCSEQFQDLYPDIPDYIVSTKKPKWYLSDKDNIALNGGLISKLNGYFTFDLKHGCIQSIEYWTWGENIRSHTQNKK